MGDEDLPFGRGTTDLYEDIDRQKGRHRITIALVALVLLGALLGGAYAAGAYWADRTYFLDETADGTVAIYRGQPGGFLIFDPTLERTSTLTVDDLASLDPRFAAEVQGNEEFSSFEDAETWVNTRVAEVDLEADAATRPPTTTTTADPTGSSTTPSSGPPTSGPATPTSQGG